MKQRRTIVSACVPISLVEAVEQAAAAQGTSVSAIINMTLAEKFIKQVAHAADQQPAAEVQK